MVYNIDEDEMNREQRHFDWMPSTDKRMIMLRNLRDTCKDCIMCELGRNLQVCHNETIDPHVFSTMTPSKYMVIGQNPGFNECKQDQPFVGESGLNFNTEIEKYGIKRSDFYITNVCKCWTPDNREPTPQEIERCKPFLIMETTILMPKLIITLGASAFGFLCPNAIYSKALGKITHSEVINKKVYAVYHPSQRNMIIESRKAQFDRQIELLCKTIKYLQKDEKEHESA